MARKNNNSPAAEKNQQEQPNPLVEILHKATAEDLQDKSAVTQLLALLIKQAELEDEHFGTLMATWEEVGFPVRPVAEIEAHEKKIPMLVSELRDLGQVEQGDFKSLVDLERVTLEIINNIASRQEYDEETLAAAKQFYATAFMWFRRAVTVESLGR